MAPAAWTTRDIRCEGSELEISARFGILAAFSATAQKLWPENFAVRLRVVYFRPAV
jgi:hypothetical protein